MSDGDIIQKVRESPTKIKRNLKELVKKLDKTGITLMDDGEVDYSQVENPAITESFRKIEVLVKTALMLRDLDFEYPHKLERRLLKADILELADEEEMKLHIQAEEAQAAQI